MEPSTRAARLQKMLPATGLPRQRFHDLWDWYASLPLVRRVPPQAVKEILGYRQVVLTMDTCIHATPAWRRRPADLMDDVLVDRA